MTATTETKLCIDCKHYLPKDSEVFDLCTHPASASGFIREVKHNYCLAMRCHPCGKDAKLFEAKDTVSSDAPAPLSDGNFL